MIVSVFILTVLNLPCFTVKKYNTIQHFGPSTQCTNIIDESFSHTCIDDMWLLTCYMNIDSSTDDHKSSTDLLKDHVWQAVLSNVQFWVQFAMYSKLLLCI